MGPNLGYLRQGPPGLGIPKPNSEARGGVPPPPREGGVPPFWGATPGTPETTPSFGGVPPGRGGFGGPEGGFPPGTAQKGPPGPFCLAIGQVWRFLVRGSTH